jgi:hypothetical protein
MHIQRTISIILPDDPDLRDTLDAFQGIQQQISEAAYNNGKPLSALALHRAVYDPRRQECCYQHAQSLYGSTEPWGAVNLP